MTIPSHEHYRRNDPQTSKAAAESLEATSMVDVLRLAFYSASWHGLTAEEAAKECGYSRYATSKRVSDLKRFRSIEPRIDERGNTVTRRGSSGRAQEVLAITRLGRMEVEEDE